MKNLLADLQVDDDEDTGWLSLEQLEKELSQLDATSSGPPGLSSIPEQTSQQPFSAASMVVSHAQNMQQQQATGALPQVPIEDAWSLSLQKFTATSLEADFLQADSARKQQATVGLPAAAAPPGLDFSAAEEYNVSESVTVSAGPPPGLTSTDPQQQLLTQAANKLMQELVGQSPSPPSQKATSQRGPATSPPPPPGASGVAKPPPFTPQNSISVGPDGVVVDTKGRKAAATPPPSVAATPAQPRTIVGAAVPPAGHPIPHGAPPPLMPMPPPQHHMPPGAPPHPIIPPVMGVQVPQGGRGSAWQVPPPPPQFAPGPPPPRPPPVRVFCNPDPSAPPIPATHLESRYMKARDISYVIHSILKPLLLEGVAPTDYDVQYYIRRNGPAAAAGTKSKGDKDGDGKGSTDMSTTLEKRSQKSKEWSAEHAVLGHVAKTNVTRPRALIAQPVAAAASTSDSKEQRQRAALWRARIYCDQAYQAYFHVMENWRAVSAASGPSGSPASVQTHYVRLFKCLGITPDTAEESSDITGTKYKVDASAMKLLLKLEKGRVLLARLLEQAVLPPNAMQALMPTILDVLCSSVAPESGVNPAQATESMTDARIFVALARVVQTLPNMAGSTILDCIRTIETHSKSALSSTSRMQCVHAILHRGSALATQAGVNPDYQQQWTKAESDFMTILAGLA